MCNQNQTCEQLAPREPPLFKGKPLSESPFYLGKYARAEAQPRTPPAHYPVRGQQSWLYGYDNPQAYN